MSYKLTPAFEEIWFSDQSGLDHGALYGGQLGFGFGRYIEVNGIYMVGPSLKTDFSAFSIGDAAADPLFATLASRDTRLSRYGGSLKFNLGYGNVFPYVSLGTGVLAMEPDGLSRSETLYMSGTIGLQLGVKDRYTFILQGSALGYRYNPASTLLSADDITAVGLSPADFGLRQVTNYSVAAGLQFYVGGRSSNSMTDIDRALKRQFSSGWRGVGLRVEPLAGQINFSQALGYQDHQRIVGVSAGIDMGAYAGLRAFYWQGTKPQTWSEFAELHAWGGELQLAFQSSGGITPFMSLGGGMMTAGDGYVGNGFAPVDDRSFGLAGLGLVIPLGSSVSLVGSARSLLMTTSGVDNLSSPGTVKSNVMVSATLGFSLGGTGDSESGGEIFGRELQSSKAERERLRTDIESTNARVDSLSQAMSGRGAVPVTGTPATARADSARTTAQPAAGPQERWMTVPVPREGELYLRFGKPGGVSMETIDGDSAQYYYDPVTGRLITAPAQATKAPAGPAAQAPSPAATSEQIDTLIRQALRDESARSQVQRDSTDAAIRQLKLSLDRRLAAVDAQMQQQQADFSRQLSEARVPQQAAAETQPQQQTNTPPASTSNSPASSGGKNKFESLRPMIGYNIDRPHQFLMGLRAEYLIHNQPYRLAPEYILGVGDGDATNTFNLNMIYSRPVGTRNRPYLGAGVGLMSGQDTDFIFNLIVGTDRRFNRGTAYLEYSTQNLFDNNRLMLGMRFGI